jgi:hypothetical protein
MGIIITNIVSAGMNMSTNTNIIRRSTAAVGMTIVKTIITAATRIAAVIPKAAIAVRIWQSDMRRKKRMSFR